MKNHPDQKVIAALSEDHICKITNLSKGQLRAWDKRGFFVPRYAYDDRRSAYSRIYSFKDAVGLKTIATLRFEYKIGIPKLVVVAKQLKEKGFEHWADTKLYVVKKEVNFVHPNSEKLESLSDGQYSMLSIIDVIRDVKEKIEEIKRRPDALKGSVERNRFVGRNAWVVSGTRIPTSTIRRYADAGFSAKEIISEYPSLTVEDIKAALEHESDNRQSA